MNVGKAALLCLRSRDLLQQRQAVDAHQQRQQLLLQLVLAAHRHSAEQVLVLPRRREGAVALRVHRLLRRLELLLAHSPLQVRGQEHVRGEVLAQDDEFEKLEDR